MQQELKKIIDRLTSSMLTSLEAAAGDCAGRGNKSVELEHWLLQLAMSSGEFARLIEQFGLDRSAMITDLEQRLDRNSSGHQGAPSLSSSLVSTMQDAWVEASLNAGQQQIRLPHLLLALINRESFMLVSSPLTDQLRRISREGLQTIARSEPSTSADNSKVESAGHAALDKYTRNLTEQAQQGKLDPISGRLDEIRQMIDILSRRRQNNPILVGDPGVGKTAVVEGLAQAVVDQQVPDNLLGIELRILDLSLLQAGASIKGEFEKRLQDVINEVQSSATPVILFIDEAHTLIGAGGAAGQNDAANLLKPALARGELRTIAATTWAEYKKYFESDAALTRRFQVVKVPEPDETDAIAMVRGVSKSLAAHHNVRVLDTAIEAAVRLSVRYLPERQLPDKAISLLDTACSRTGLSARATPASINKLQQQQDYLNQEKSALELEWNASNEHQLRLQEIDQELTELTDQQTALTQKWSEEKELSDALLTLTSELDGKRNSDSEFQPDSEQLEQLNQLQQQLKELQAETPLVKPFVDDQSIAQVIEGWTGIPAGNMVADETERLLKLEQSLAERIIGQKLAINAISETIRINRTGLGDQRRPMGVFLMCGPSGVGKTETALALAEQLFGGEQNLTVINMTEFKEEHKVSMLLGAPAGYVGYGEGGVLTEAVRRKPHSIILLDEMEKAHPGVHDIFYQIFDKGRISDSAGQEVDFRNTLIIMTSNAADFAICDYVQKSAAPTRSG